MDRLKDKVAIITGALGGQGQVAVARFLVEGARVLASDLARQADGEVARLLAQRPDDVAYVGGDVCDDAICAAIVDSAKQLQLRLESAFV